MAVVVRKDGTQVPLKGFKIGGQAFGSTASQTESAVYTGGSSGGAPSYSSRPPSRPPSFISGGNSSVSISRAQTQARADEKAREQAAARDKAARDKAARDKAAADKAAADKAAAERLAAEKAAQDAQDMINANKISGDARASSTGQMPADQGFLGGIKSLFGLDDGEDTSRTADLTAQNLASKTFGKDYDGDGKVTYAEAARTQRESDEGYYKSTREKPDRKFSMDPVVTALNPLAGIALAGANKLGLTDSISMAMKAGIFSNPQKGYDNLISKGVDEDVAMDYIQTSIANRGQRADSANSGTSFGLRMLEPNYVDPFDGGTDMPNVPVNAPDPCPNGYVFDSEVQACVIQYEAPKDVFTFTNEPGTNAPDTDSTGSPFSDYGVQAEYDGPTSFLSPIKNPFA